MKLRHDNPLCNLGFKCNQHPYTWVFTGAELTVYQPSDLADAAADSGNSSSSSSTAVRLSVQARAHLP